MKRNNLIPAAIVIGSFMLGLFIYMSQKTLLTQQVNSKSKESADTQTAESIFKNKQDCAKYKDVIQKEISEWNNSGSMEKKRLDEVFYSPKVNSCLYSFTYIYLDSSGVLLTTMGKGYVITDYLNGNDLFSDNSEEHKNVTSKLPGYEDTGVLFEEYKELYKSNE